MSALGGFVSSEKSKIKVDIDINDVPFGLLAEGDRSRSGLLHVFWIVGPRTRALTDGVETSLSRGFAPHVGPWNDGPHNHFQFFHTGIQLVSVSRESRIPKCRARCPAAVSASPASIEIKKSCALRANTLAPRVDEV